MTLSLVFTSLLRNAYPPNTFHRDPVRMQNRAIDYSVGGRSSNRLLSSRSRYWLRFFFGGIPLALP